ncbi:hypothetical protein NPIL_452891 [Nephila pilipes]|uniref:Uncharacterized protein n=1 Tax=Nephila pilipes TaxID=299642 RepID=A0A8X6MU99_NEPPI|nr:hypothetical protein NPIL_452891 [Nephila pilipes]
MQKIILEPAVFKEHYTELRGYLKDLGLNLKYKRRTPHIAVHRSKRRNRHLQRILCCCITPAGCSKSTRRHRLRAALKAPPLLSGCSEKLANCTKCRCAGRLSQHAAAVQLPHQHFGKEQRCRDAPRAHALAPANAVLLPGGSHQQI